MVKVQYYTRVLHNDDSDSNKSSIPLVLIKLLGPTIKSDNPHHQSMNFRLALILFELHTIVGAEINCESV